MAWQFTNGTRRYVKPAPWNAYGLIGFSVRDYYLSLFHGAVRYRQYLYVTVHRGYRYLHGEPITATGRVEVIKIRLRSYCIR